MKPGRVFSLCLLAAALAANGLPGWAQLRPPALPSLPSTPGVANNLPPQLLPPAVPPPAVPSVLPGGLPAPSTVLPSTVQLVESVLAPVNLEGLRQRAVDQLLRRHPQQLQRDPAGEPVVSGELLAVPSSPAALAGLLAVGFVVLREETLQGLDERWMVLRPPAGMALGEALARLRGDDPAGHYDYHHLYTGSGGPPTGPDRAVVPAGPVGRVAATPVRPAPPGLRVGLLDSGVDPRHPSLRSVPIRRHGCGGQVLPGVHGTAVASLLVGQGAGFRGALPGAQLWAADVYCGDAPAGGSVQAIAQALAWLARERVPVVNVSLVGPPNVLLERALAAMVARGHLVVAAVGNDGPAAAPLYPAAYAQALAGVVAVTGTDARRRVLAEAGRGAHVAFAAPGADLAAAWQGDTSFTVVRGTSFAAPLVAGLLAGALDRPDAEAAAQALAGLAAAAVDLGTAGRDPTYGHGLVGESLRTDPGAVQLARTAR
jgi:hypothetical protein